jgi:xanthine/uracil permease
MPYHIGKGPQISRRVPPFYSLDADLPILLAIVAGFQHCLAMIGGLVTPPIIFAVSCIDQVIRGGGASLMLLGGSDVRRQNALALPAATQSYMISASLIASGILSAVQMSRFKLPFGYYLGTGE